MGDLARGRSEQQPGKSSVSQGSHDEKARIFGGIQKRGGGGIPNEHSRDVHALSSDGLQRVLLDLFGEVKRVATVEGTGG
ncbi:hypothetical protein BJQ90_01191 [Arthrobacter sp. SO3]|nr:hypothetical protein [Arthrobacter sp. SO3]